MPDSLLSLPFMTLVMTFKYSCVLSWMWAYNYTHAFISRNQAFLACVFVFLRAETKLPSPNHCNATTAVVNTVNTLETYLNLVQ